MEPLTSQPNHECLRLAECARYHQAVRNIWYNFDGREVILPNNNNNYNTGGPSLVASGSSLPTRILLSDLRRSSLVHSLSRVGSKKSSLQISHSAVETQEQEEKEEAEKKQLHNKEQASIASNKDAGDRIKQKEEYERQALQIECPILKHFASLDDAQEFKAVIKFLHRQEDCSAMDGINPCQREIDFGTIVYEREYPTQSNPRPRAHSAESKSSRTSPQDTFTPPSPTSPLASPVLFASLNRRRISFPSISCPSLDLLDHIPSPPSPRTSALMAPPPKQTWIRVKVIYIRDPVTNSPAFLVIEEDISDVKNLQHALTHQKQLHSLFLADLSHELRTPLNGVTGMLQHLLLEKSLSPEQLTDISRALASANAMVDLFESMLDAPSAESEASVAASRVNVVSLIDTIQMLQSVVQEKFQDQVDTAPKVEVLIEYPMHLIGLIDAKCDLGQVQEVLGHLISSALRRTKQLLLENKMNLRRRHLMQITLKIRDNRPGAQSFQWVFKIRSPVTPPPLLLLPISVRNVLEELPHGQVHVGKGTYGGGTQYVFSLNAEKVTARHAGGGRMRTLPWPKGELRVWVISPRDKEIAKTLNRCYARKKIDIRYCHAIKNLPKESGNTERQIVLVDEAVLGDESKEEALRSVEDAIPAQCYVLLLDQRARGESGEGGEGGGGGGGGAAAAALNGWKEMSKPLDPLGLYYMLIRCTSSNPSTPTTKKKESEEGSGGETKGVLVVEDTDLNVKVFTKLLSRLNVRNVEVVENGLEAVARMKEQISTSKMLQRTNKKKRRCKTKPKKSKKKKLKANKKESSGGAKAKKKIGLVLMDVRMPVMDGIAASKRIREIEKEAMEESLQCERVPIVAVSAGATERERIECTEAGMDAFLAKPLQLKELAEVLQKFLGVQAVVGAGVCEGQK